MITVQTASTYSIGSEVAHQIDYSDGTSVRAVEAPGHIIRKEWKHPAKGWIMVGKPYVVNHSKVRSAEIIKRMAQEFLAK